MSKEIVKKQVQDLYKGDSIIKLADFDALNALLNQPVPSKWIKTNPYANNSKYIPIDKIEHLLRRIFKRYRIEVLSVAQLFNAISVTVRLHYLHPVTGDWDFTDGVGAKALQLKKGSTSFDFANISGNAADMALPIAKSQAVKNACYSLGRVFGADLNRSDILEFKADDVLQDKKFEIEKSRMEEAIKNGYEPTEEEKEKYGL